MNKLEKGRSAERMAREHLRKEGYRILATNYRSKEQEIDIICLSPENVLCFVEVRYGSFFSPVETITRRKMKKIIEGALRFASEIAWDGDIRFDVIAFQNTNICHIKSAFNLDDIDRSDDVY